jgi:hypothetical protein
METSFLWEIAAISTKTSFCAKHFDLPETRTKITDQFYCCSKSFVHDLICGV